MDEGGASVKRGRTTMDSLDADVEVHVGIDDDDDDDGCTISPSLKCSIMCWQVGCRP